MKLLQTETRANIQVHRNQQKKSKITLYEEEDAV
jgi:hypothetical protein